MIENTEETEEEMDEKESILIVDDDESTLKTLALIFDQKGYETETAMTGREAIEKAREMLFNLVFLDIKLPDMEGVELLAPLKKMHPDMVVIIITGYASLETAVRALDEGAAAYITKPLNMDEVLVKVRAGLEKRRLAMENARLYQEAQRELAERKRAEKELKQSEERYRSLVEDINDGYFIIQDGEFIYFNQAFANILGYTREENLVRKFLRFLSPKYLGWRSRDDQRGEEDREQGGEDELEILGEGGKNLVLEICSRVIDYNGRSGIAGICRDITDRKKAERDLRERIEELERWYRLIVDRELKMTHLKERIQELNSKLKLVRERYGVNI